MLADLIQSVSSSGSLARFTRPSLIVARLEQRDPAGVIQELSRALQREGFVTDLLPFYHAALNQELLSGSFLESGIAIPHARLSGIKQLQFALGRAPEPISWAGRTSCPAQLVFLLAVPATDAACYLNVLSSLARLGQQPEIREALLLAKDASEIHQVLDTVRIRAG